MRALAHTHRCDIVRCDIVHADVGEAAKFAKTNGMAAKFLGDRMDDFPCDLCSVMQTRGRRLLLKFRGARAAPRTYLRLADRPTPTSDDHSARHISFQ